MLEKVQIITKKRKHEILNIKNCNKNINCDKKVINKSMDRPIADHSTVNYLTLDFYEDRNLVEPPNFDDPEQSCISLLCREQKAAFGSDSEDEIEKRDSAFDKLIEDSKYIAKFRPMIHIVVFLTLFISARHESGYLYSIAERKFLSYNERGNEDLIFLTKEMPKPLGIVYNGNNSVSIKTNQVESESLDGSNVFDSSRSNYDLISYSYHGSDNQQFQMTYVGNDTMKLITGGRCITTEKGFKFLTEVDCSDSPGQLFRWVPRKDEGRIREYLRKCQQARHEPSDRSYRSRSGGYNDRGYDRNPYPRDSYYPDNNRQDSYQPDYRSGPMRDEYRNSPRDPFSSNRDSYSPYEKDRVLTKCLGLNENDLRERLNDLKAIAADPYY